MKMTLDEAIQHYREVVEDNIQKSRKMTKDPFCVVNLDKIEVCNKCAEEHEQLADWLEEYKAYKEIGTVQGYQSAIDSYNTEHTLRLDAEQRLYKLTQQILGYIHSGNRGNCDYFIVDQIEELLEGGNNG